MVGQYCAVFGCRHNSKTMPHLTYYKILENDERLQTRLQNKREPCELSSRYLVNQNTSNMRSETNLFEVKIETETVAERDISIIETSKIKSQRSIDGVKIETESDSEAENVTGLYTDRITPSKNKISNSKIHSEPNVFDVKPETESDGDAQSVTDLYADHEIKEEMAIGPVVLQPADYNYSTNNNCEADIEVPLPGRLETDAIPSTRPCEDEPLFEPSLFLTPVTRTYCRPGRNSAARCPKDAPLPKKPRLETKNDKTDQDKPQEHTKGNDSEEVTSVIDSNKNTFTDIETRGKGRNEEPIENVNLLERIQTSKMLNNECRCNDNDCEHSGENCTLTAHVESHVETKRDNNLKCTEGPHQTETQEPLEQHSTLQDVHKSKKEHRLQNQKSSKNIRSAKIKLITDLFNYKTNDISNLKRHLKGYFEGKPYCSHLREPGPRFIEKSSSTKHSSSSSNPSEKRFSCHLCAEKFTYKYELTRHLRIHTGEKPYSCDICKHKYSRKSHLTRHLRTCTGEKSYSCSFCDSKFSRKSALRQHLRTHTAGGKTSCTGEKPYSCSFCDNKFSSKSALNRHLRTHTGG